MRTTLARMGRVLSPVCLLGCLAAPVTAAAADGEDCKIKLRIVDGELETVQHAMRVDRDHLAKYLGQLDTAIRVAKVWCSNDAVEMEVLQRDERSLMDMRAILEGRLNEVPDISDKERKARERCETQEELHKVLQDHKQVRKSNDPARIAEHLKIVLQVVRSYIDDCSFAPRLVNQLKQVEAGCIRQIAEYEAKAKQSQQKRE
jgi:hypothetical protein